MLKNTFLHRPANSPHSTRRYKKHMDINTGHSGTVAVVEVEEMGDVLEGVWEGEVLLGGGLDKAG